MASNHNTKRQHINKKIGKVWKTFYRGKEASARMSQVNQACSIKELQYIYSAG